MNSCAEHFIALMPMLVIVAGLAAYVTIGQIIPVIFSLISFI